MQSSRRRLATILMCACAGLLAACNYSTNEDVTVREGTSHRGDAVTINGNVRVEKDADARDSSFRTINGNVVVEEGAKVSDCETVNGSVRIGDGTEAGDLRTVNGDLSVGRDAHIDGQVQLVNGSVRLASGSRVQGDVGTVNGLIEMRSATVNGDLTNTNGGMLITDGSEVLGGIRVEAVDEGSEGEPPRIIVGPGVRIRGESVFERPVELHVHDSAEMGPVSGAQVIRYSGSEPG